MPRRSSPELTKAKNRFRGTTAKVNALLSLRSENPISLLPELAAWSQPWTVALKLGAQPVPRILAQVQSITIGSVLSVERELLWAKGLILKFAPILKKHVGLRRELAATLLAGSNADCLTALDNIQNAVGLSFGLTSLRIAILQIIDGLESQKDYAAHLRSSGASDQLGFYSFWWSIRAQDETSEQHFKASFEQRLSEWQVQEPDRTVIRYLVLGETPPVGAEAALLNGFSGAPVVDLYEALVDLAAASVAEERDAARAFVQVVEDIAPLVGDPRLDRILLSAGLRQTLPQVPDTRFREAWLQQSTPPDLPPSTAEEFLSSVQDLQISWTQNAFASRLSSSLALASVRSSHDTSARKMALILSQSSLGKWIGSVSYDSEIGAVPFGRDRGVLRYIYSGDSLLDVIPHLSAEARELYARWVQFELGSTIGSAAAALVGAAPTRLLRPSAERRFALWRATFAGTPEEILVRSEQVLGSEFSEEALYLKAAALLALGSPEEAVDFAVEQLVEDASRHYSLPINELVASVYPNGVNAYPARITTSLLLYFYAQHLNPEASSYLSYSAEDYVFGLGLERPSELTPDALHLNPTFVRTFLQDVCSLATIRLFTAFDSERSIEDERIRICQTLAGWLPEDRDTFENEALSIVRGRLVKDAILEIQKSKISVDEQGLLNWARRNAKEDFERYQALLATGLVVVNEEFRMAVLDALSTRTVAPRLFEVPRNEASTLFIELVKRLLNEIATNPEFGLDCYLSLRIRHGTLSGAMRSAPETEHIVTRKEADGGAYRSNEHWKELLEVSNDQWQAVDARLSRFTGDLDRLIEELASRYVQVRRDEKADGLFRQTAPAISILTLALEVTQETSFEDFFDKVVDLFWQLLESDLKAAQLLLDGDIRSRQRELYDAAEQEFRSDADLIALADAFLRARNQADLSIDMIRDWFELPIPSGQLALSVNELIDISMEATKRLHPDFQPVLDVPTFEDIPSFRGALNLFSDIFFVVFENIYAHSGLSTPSIAVRCEAGPEYIDVRVESAVAPGDIERHAENIAAARRRIEEKSYLDVLNREGGTGFPKLARLIRYRDSAADLDFGIDLASSIFWLRFRLMTRILEGS